MRKRWVMALDEHRQKGNTDIGDCCQGNRLQRERQKWSGSGSRSHLQYGRRLHWNQVDSIRRLHDNTLRTVQRFGRAEAKK